MRNLFGELLKCCSGGCKKWCKPCVGNRSNAVGKLLKVARNLFGKWLVNSLIPRIPSIRVLLLQCTVSAFRLRSDRICARLCEVRNLQIDWTEPHGSRLVAGAFDGPNPASEPVGGGGGSSRRWCENCLGNCSQTAESLLRKLQNVARNLFGKLPTDG